jgi:DNA-binding response OmpR family regulator
MKRYPLILVADDELPMLKLLSTSFVLEGYDVIAADNGPAALEAFEGLKPDLVVLDVGMTGIDGLCVLEQIRRYSQTPVIMLTGQDDPEGRDRAREAGADEYMLKPFDRADLIARVRARVGRGGVRRREADVA